MSRVDELMQSPDIRTLLQLMAVMNNNVYEHCQHVARYTEGILSRYTGQLYNPERDKDVNSEEEKRDEIIKGALVHDIGKLFIPLNLTESPYRLTKKEFKIIQIHSTVSYEIVHGTPNREKAIFSKTIEDICVYHHEKPNGQGYCDGKNLYGLPKEVFLVQMADVYAALVEEERPYKPSYDAGHALRLLKEMCLKLDLDDTFFEPLSNYIEEENLYGNEY